MRKAPGMALLTLIILTIAWIAGGWPTGKFYATPTWEYHKKWKIVHEYDWGLDQRVGKVKYAHDIPQAIKQLEEVYDKGLLR
jgi:hypothetical protein